MRFDAADVAGSTLTICDYENGCVSKRVTVELDHSTVFMLVNELRRWSEQQKKTADTTLALFGGP